MSIEKVQHSKIEPGSNRSFGLVFFVVFIVIGLFPLLSQEPVRIWAIAVSAAFILLAFIAPSSLRHLNILWFKFGMLLSRIVNPIVMLLIYVLTIVPTGLIMRLLGKDLLDLKLDQSQTSYWITRQPPGPSPESLEEQF